MKTNSNVTIHDIAGEKIAIMNLDGRKTRAISFNSTSLYLWESVQGKEFSVEDLAELILAKYDTDRKTALADAAKWVKELKKYGLLI